MLEPHLSEEYLNFFACDSTDMKINEVLSSGLKAFRLALQLRAMAPPLFSPAWNIRKP